MISNISSQVLGYGSSLLLLLTLFLYFFQNTDWVKRQRTALILFYLIVIIVLALIAMSLRKTAPDISKIEEIRHKSQLGQISIDH
jgi:Na+/melibiose symporter-like transporter